MVDNINKIILPNSLVADLYESLLVETENSGPAIKNEPETVAEPEPVQIKPANEITLTLGQNRKNILVIVKNEPAGLPGGNDLAFLTGILQACKLELDDTVVISLQDYASVGYKVILNQFNSKQVILFGASAADLDLPVLFPDFQVQAVAKTQFLSAPALAAISADKLLKSKLWVCLRRLFNV